MRRADPTPAWPPLIPRTRAPWWLRFRDICLTLVAWFILLWVLRDALLSLVAGVSPEAAARTSTWIEHRLSPMLGELVPVAPHVFWRELSGFVYAALAFVAWLAVWGWLNREQLKRQPPASAPSSGNADDPAPAALSTAAQFAAAGVQQDPTVWQHGGRLRVAFDGAGRVMQVRAGDAPPG